MQSFLSGELNIATDEAFVNTVRSYVEVFLRSDRVNAMVRHGGCSLTDFRDIFKTHVERRVRCLPDIAGLTKDAVVSSWMSKFDQVLTAVCVRACLPENSLFTSPIIGSCFALAVLCQGSKKLF